MKIKFGAIVVYGRGKIGGHVASKNRAGSYMRTKVTPSNPNTLHQAAVRNSLSTNATNWGALASSERLAWNGAVDTFKSTNIFGDIKKPSGFNLYVKLNTMLQLIGVVTELTSPPLPVTLPVIGSGTLSAGSPSNLELVMAAAPDVSATDLLVYATPAQNPGKSFVKSEFRLLGKAPAISTLTFDFSTLYTARFGGIAPIGKQIFVKLQQVSKTTGQAGIPVMYSAIISD
jgi:hypothetical protein